MLTILITHSGEVTRNQIAGFISSVVRRYNHINNVRFVTGYRVTGTDIWFMCDEIVQIVGLTQLSELGEEGEMDNVSKMVKSGEWMVCYFGEKISINLLNVFGGTGSIVFFGVSGGEPCSWNTLVPVVVKTSDWTPKCLLKLLM